MVVQVRYQIPAFPGVLTGTGGPDIYQGTPNLETGQFDAGRRGAIIVDNAQGPISVTSAAGVDTIRSVETLLFVDGREVYNPEDSASQVVRLYHVALGRDVDQGGLNTFAERLDNGDSLSNVASALINSTEFTNHFGANLTNTQFVDALYHNMRGTSAPSAEIAGWTVLIDRGELSRADVAVQFAQSTENRADTASIVNAGIWDRDESAISIANLYDTAFNRLPDLGGLEAWVSLVHGQNFTMHQVADSFYNSTEAAPLRAMNDTDFINTIYNNALGRSAEAGGLANWVSHLHSDMSHVDVMLAISDSAEHQQITAEQFQSANPLNYGVTLIA